ncbi:hypothetical protein [uncultured Tateyamaria sp.]|uniref:hypothetical protein n=1 Tax=uncultured Tateyamaria sp. TaxID=455651 RepID=UPI00261CFE05|nr:hypothetical protein [uncultured Tateyamaria sp.]
MKGFAFLLALVICVAPLRAQEGWPDLDVLLGSTLAPGGQFEVSFWLPDAADPAQARQAIGVVYPIIVGAAGNTGIAVGHFVRVEGGWAYAGLIGNLFGHNPRDAAFLPGAVQLTTTMLGPNEPRCCPTLPVRWQIDLATRQAQRLN